MTTPCGEIAAGERAALLSGLDEGGGAGTRALWGAHQDVALAQLRARSAIDAAAEELRGRRVLVLTADPLAAALALVELDGLVHRLVLCPPGVPPDHLCAICATAEVDAIAGDDPALWAALPSLPSLRVDAALPRPREPVERRRRSEWILLTSGTSGVPKLVVHTLQTLAGAVPAQGTLSGPKIWGTFYDVRRYGGLQILLRALLGGGSLVVGAPDESLPSLLARCAAHGVTHLTGTPTHWRRALMQDEARALQPQYARMSGEIADQAIIDRVQAAYPAARVAHAFASTEAGVGFEVDDGREGFPALWLQAPLGAIELRVQDGTLRIRSPRTALRYLGGAAGALQDAQGYVDTGDVIEQRAGRAYFAGRRGGVINVGGLKVHPEEIEAVLLRHPGVHLARVKARRNPITGAIVVADVVPGGSLDAQARAELPSALLAHCRAELAAYKVPALIHLVTGIEMSAAGKLARADG